MSYILEALRRSQAERERGRVPGLGAQPLPADAADGRGRGRPVAWQAGGVAALLLVAVLLASWWLRPAPAPMQATADTPAAAAPPLPAPGPAPVPAPPPAAVPPPRLPQVVSVPPAAQPTRPAAPPQTAATAEPVPPPAAPAPQPQAQPAAPAPPPRVLTLAQLSADQRRELPAMAVGGSIWSDNAANRFVIINGQVVREGETAAPGVTLERIAPKALTLRWRELRIEMPL